MRRHRHFSSLYIADNVDLFDIFISFVTQLSVSFFSFSFSLFWFSFAYLPQLVVGELGITFVLTCTRWTIHDESS